MNQSIGCGPMPFAPVSDKAAAESATILPGASSGSESESSFSEVLDSELKDESRPPKEEADAWAVYGIVPEVVQLLPTIAALSLSEFSSVAEEKALIDETSQSESITESLIEPASENDPQESVPTEEVKSALQALKLAEQKVPSLTRASTPATEQFAENPAKPAKIAYGTVAAQGQSMVADTPKQEETALEQNLSLSAEGFTDTDVEALAPLKPISPAKNSSSDTKFNYADFAPVESVKSEWSSFEGISESSDLQPVKATEAVEVAEAIRTHVQVLKGSSQAKLDVVLRPDGQTELRLHVEKINGQIMVQARCDRGDFARLESNWTAVQQSLANQGVRVESLEHGNFSQSQDNFQNPSRAFDERSPGEHQRDTNFIEHKVRPSKIQPPVTSRGPVQGWQSWA